MAVADEPSVGGGGGDQRPVAKKSAWTKDEDAVLREQVRLHGPQGWAAIARALPGRNPKSCRLRWCQHLAPYVDAARPFTPCEDARIAELQRLHTNKWATIAGFLPGRSDNAIKNRWNSVLSKQQPQPLAPAAALPRRADGTLPLFPVAPGDARARRGEVPVLSRPPNRGAGIDLSAACLQLFPLASGDLVRGHSASEAAPMDVDCGADNELMKLRLWPSPWAIEMAKFKAAVQAIRAP